MKDIKNDFEMNLKDWLKENPTSSREILIDLQIDSYEQEDDLTEYENEMLEYLYSIT